jgi:hypothetical protein
VETLKNNQNLSDEIFGNKLVTILISTVIILSGLDMFFYFKLSDVKMVEANYDVLENRTQTLETYYQQLHDQYSSLMTDYTDMKGRYEALVLGNTLLQREYNDVINHDKQVLLEEKQGLRLQPDENTTIIYEIPASGYVEIEVNSTKEIFVWVGSSIIDETYYARLPSFPQTASVLSFKVPVSPDLYFFIENADTDEAEIEYSINLVY